MDRTTLDIVKDALLKQPEILAKEFERQSNKQKELFKFAIDNTSLTDKKLIKILEEQANSEGKYKEKIDKLLNDYVKEKNIQGDQLEELNKLMKESARIQEYQNDALLQERRREQRENPLTAFKHAFEDLTKTKDIKESSKTLGKGLLEGFNLKTISKGLLHGAGVLFDNPALNILADKISTSVKYQEIQNQRQFEFLKELEEIDANEPRDKKSKAEEEFKNNALNTKDIISEIKLETDNGLNETNIKPVIEKLNSIEGNTESTYIDLGSTLENIKDELEKQTSIYKEQLFIAKDSANDTSTGSNLIEYKRPSTALKPEEEEKEGDFGLLGSIAEDLFNGNGRGRKGKGLKNTLKGAMKSLGSVAMSIGRIAGPIALVTGAVVSVYEGFKGFQEAGKTFDLKPDEIATTSQKLTGAVSSIVDALTFGLLDEKAIAQKIDAMTSYLTSGIKKIIGQYNDSDSLTDELEKQNVVDKSLLGNSEIRDWDAISKLNLDQLQALYNYNDWDRDTQEKLRALIRSKKREMEPQETPVYTSTNYVPPTMNKEEVSNLGNLNKEAVSAGVGSMTKEQREAWYAERGYDVNTGKFTPIKSSDTSTSSNLNTVPNVSNEKLPEPNNTPVVQQAPVIVQAPPATVINNSTQERKIDNLNLTDKDSATLVSILGIGK